MGSVVTDAGSVVTEVGSLGVATIAASVADAGAVVVTSVGSAGTATGSVVVASATSGPRARSASVCGVRPEGSWPAVSERTRRGMLRVISSARGGTGWRPVLLPRRLAPGSGAGAISEVGIERVVGVLLGAPGRRRSVGMTMPSLLRARSPFLPRVRRAPGATRLGTCSTLAGVGVEARAGLSEGTGAAAAWLGSAVGFGTESRRIGLTRAMTWRLLARPGRSRGSGLLRSLVSGRVGSVVRRIGSAGAGAEVGTGAVGVAGPEGSAGRGSAAEVGPLVTLRVAAAEIGPD